MIIIKIVFASLGVVSCIVPGILTGMVQILLGLPNIVGGAALLIKRFLTILHEIRTPPAAPVIVPPILKKLTVTQTVLNLVTIAFGVSMLVPGLVPGLLIAGILVINGLLLFLLASFLQKVIGMQSSGVQASIQHRGSSGNRPQARNWGGIAQRRFDRLKRRDRRLATGRC